MKQLIRLARNDRKYFDFDVNKSTPWVKERDFQMIAISEMIAYLHGEHGDKWPIITGLVDF